ncbi:hypothetical protein CG415_26510, partial [Shigella flexneri]
TYSAERAATPGRTGAVFNLQRQAAVVHSNNGDTVIMDEKKLKALAAELAKGLKTEVLRAYIFCGACGNTRTNRGSFQFAASGCRGSLQQRR